MRQGSSCFLLEAQPGSLAELQRHLERCRIGCRRGADDQGAADAVDDVLVVEIDDAPVATVSLMAQAWHAAGRPVLALCREAGPKASSFAASIAADEILTCPLDGSELCRRVDQLGALTALERERRLRVQLFAPYLVERHAIQAAEPRPQVCLLGEPGEAQVQLVNALPPATLCYLERPGQLRSHLAASCPDLVLITRPDLLAAVLAAVDAADAPPGSPALLAAHRGPPTSDELPPQIDLLALPAPPEMIRARLGLALRLARLRRWLRRPPPAEGRNLLTDSLTGLYNVGLMLDYLSARERALVAIQLGNLREINAQAGYAAGNMALAEIGRRLTRITRPDDLVAHLGSGRFVVAVDAPTQARIEQMRLGLASRLSVASEPALRLAIAAEPLPLRGSPPERVDRVFHDLARLRRAA